jgi:hypothetical protein
VEHRHLLPDEFDLLVDGEEGFGVAPLMGHVESCPTCRAGLDQRRGTVAALERLPHLSPSPLFAYHVMRDVQILEPWHVAALESARRFVPHSGPVRALAASAAGLVALAFTAATIWAVGRLDAVLFLVSLVTQRARASVIDVVSGLLSSTFGHNVTSTLGGSSSVTALVGASVFIALVLVAAVSLRAVTAPSRRRRS